jgi:hypothetical protein
MLQGEVDHAQAVLRQALAIEPDLPRFQVALTRLRWPGLDYQSMADVAAPGVMPGVYIEIGVDRGESFALTRWPTRVIGVDPMPIGDVLACCTTPTQLYEQRSA